MVFVVEGLGFFRVVGVGQCRVFRVQGLGSRILH